MKVLPLVLSLLCTAGAQANLVDLNPGGDQAAADAAEERLIHAAIRDLNAFFDEGRVVPYFGTDGKLHDLHG